MSLDKSLKTAANLSRHRNVLSRNERINVLREEERWRDGQSPIGLPKVAHRKVTVGGKDKKAAKAEEKKEEGAAPAASK
jgi:small basic protein (TIGR04137 family)